MGRDTKGKAVEIEEALENYIDVLVTGLEMD